METSAHTSDERAPASPAGLYASAIARDLPLLALLAAFVAEPSTRTFALVNLAVQLTLFVLGACVPAHRTRIMAVVDAVWPWGLVAIGVQALVFGDAGSATLLVVAGVYIVMGLRMGGWGLYAFTTAFPPEDLPRYQYRRLEWRREGYPSERFPMLHEILQQALSNVTLLAAPAMVAVAAGGDGIAAVAVAGAVVWAVAFALESLADLQKARFARGAPRETCEVGLWRYSRHPNYFFQWVQWTVLVAITLPPLVRLAGDMELLAWIGFAVALLLVPLAMYYVLVHFTGAIPAEHFSVQRRPDYRDYQRRVSRFVPRRPAAARDGAGSR